MSYLLVLSTVSSRRQAVKIADLLIQKRVAACISILPGVLSCYQWKGKKEKSREVLLLIKTRASLFHKLKGLLVKNHPYLVPEVIALPFSKGHTPYLRWLEKETSS